MHQSLSPAARRAVGGLDSAASVKDKVGDVSVRLEQGSGKRRLMKSSYGVDSFISPDQCLLRKKV